MMRISEKDCSAAAEHFTLFIFTSNFLKKKVSGVPALILPQDFSVEVPSWYAHFPAKQYVGIVQDIKKQNIAAYMIKFDSDTQKRKMLDLTFFYFHSTRNRTYARYYLKEELVDDGN